jgi:glycogen synthase
MHILVTADTVGGVWTYARELVSGLVRRGNRVTLVSFGEIPTPAQTEWMEGLRNVDYHATAFRLEWMQDSKDDLAASSEYLLGLIGEVKPDLLHFNQFCYGSLTVSIPKIVVAHSDVVSWWAEVKGCEPSADEWINFYRETVGAGLSAATLVVAPSQWMLERVNEIYKLQRPGTVIYNGRTPSLFNPHVTKDDYAICVGRIWDAGKQASLLTHIDTPMPLYIVGSERHADESLRREGLLDLEIRSQINFKGQQTEGQLRHLYSRAATYIATSRYEPFGLAPLEAALSRCAILANDVPTFREVWGPAALYFERDDPQSLRTQLNRLHFDRELRLTYANLAYNRARQRFTADRMVDDYVALYQALVSQGAIAA